MARSRKKQPVSYKHHLRWSLLTAGLIVVVSLAWFADAYGGRMMPGTRIGIVPVGGLTISEAQQRVSQVLSGQQITLTYQQQTWTPTWEELGMVYDLVPSLSEAFSQGRWAPIPDWGRHLVLQQPVPLNYTWSNDKLEQYLSRIVTSLGEPPIEPHVSFRDGQFTVTKERSGIVIDDDALQEALRRWALTGGSTTIVLTPEIQWPEATQEHFATAIMQAQNIVAQPITITGADKTYTADANQLASWLTFVITDPNAVEVQVNQAAVGSWLLSVAKEINLEPEAKEILISANREEVLTSGVDGRALDIQAAVERLTPAIMNQQAAVELAVYTIPPDTAFAQTPAAPIEEGKVIAVDLSKQWEYVYEDGVLVYSSAISSGLNDWTPTGTFNIYAKTKKQKMSGPDYYVPNVPNILWFLGDYSIHGVYWHEDFGIRPRSHGCVGMPLDQAAWLYDWAEVGTPVVIYKSAALG